MNATSPQPRGLKPKRQRLYLVLGALTLLALATTLILSALEDNISFFYDPSDIASGKVQTGQRFRIGGLVVNGSITRSEGSMSVNFVVTDQAYSTPVVYTGILPDLFKEGQGVVAEGRLGEDGVFIAETVLAKHDENYMSPEVAESLKEKGLWQHTEGGTMTTTLKKPDGTTPDSTDPDGTENDTTNANQGIDNIDDRTINDGTIDGGIIDHSYIDGDIIDEDYIDGDKINGGTR